MTTDLTTLTEDTRDAIEGDAIDRLTERIADRVGARANVKAVFGEPIARGDITVIPVARIRWGFGGGGGSANDATTAGAAASGTGGGGGVLADPIGYLEIGPDGAAFKPIGSAYPSVPFLIASGVCAAIIVRAFGSALGRVIRG